MQKWTTSNTMNAFSLNTSHINYVTIKELRSSLFLRCFLYNIGKGGLNKRVPA